MKLDTKALADRLGIKPKTLDNWRSDSVGPPYYKLGARIVYDSAEVDAWLVTRRRATSSDPGASPPAAA